MYSNYNPSFENPFSLFRNKSIQREGDVEGVGLYSLADLIQIYLDEKTEFVIYHSHPPGPGMDFASRADSLNFSRIENVLGLLANYSKVDVKLLKSKYLQEVYEEIEGSSIKSRIVNSPNRVKKVLHVIAYQDAGIDFLVFPSKTRELQDIAHKNSRLNRVLLGIGRLKVLEDRPQFDHIIRY